MNTEDEIIYENLSLGHLQEIIGYSFDNLLNKDKRSKDYKDCKNFYNKIVKIYNTKAKHKTFTTIK